MSKSDQELVASGCADLSVVAARVHDLWFDLDQVHAQRLDNQVTLRLGARQAPPSLELVIANVEAVEVLDEAQIRIYDINELLYSSPVLTLTSGFPLVLNFTVSSLWVKIQALR